MVLDLLDDANSEISNYVNSHIDIAYVHRLRTSFLPLLTQRFLQAEKRSVTFSFHEGITNSILTGLMKGKYDIGFCSYSADYPDIYYHPIITVKLVAIVPIDHELANRETISVKELSDFPIVSYTTRGILGARIQEMLINYGVIFPSTMVAEDESMLYAHVKDHYGIGITFYLPDLAGDSVKQIQIREDDFFHTYYMAYTKDRMTAVVRRFVYFVENHYDHSNTLSML